VFQIQAVDLSTMSACVLMTCNSVSFDEPFLSKKSFELHVKVGAVLDL
jgi:hypothetical protein